MMGSNQQQQVPVSFLLPARCKTYRVAMEKIEVLLEFCILKKTGIILVKIFSYVVPGSSA